MTATYAQARRAYLVLADNDAVMLRRLARTEIEGGTFVLAQHRPEVTQAAADAEQSALASLKAKGLADEEAKGHNQSQWTITAKGKQLFHARRPCFLCSDTLSCTVDGHKSLCSCTVRLADRPQALADLPSTPT